MIAFQQGAANILGMAIERERYERQLKSALDRHQVLANKMTHRVKNSLQIASSMLHLQASSSDDDDPGTAYASIWAVLPSVAPMSGYLMTRILRKSILGRTSKRCVQTPLA